MGQSLEKALAHDERDGSPFLFRSLAQQPGRFIARSSPCIGLFRSEERRYLLMLWAVKSDTWSTVVIDRIVKGLAAKA